MYISWQALALGKCIPHFENSSIKCFTVCQSMCVYFWVCLCRRRCGLHSSQQRSDWPPPNCLVPVPVEKDLPQTILGGRMHAICFCLIWVPLWLCVLWKIWKLCCIFLFLCVLFWLGNLESILRLVIFVYYFGLSTSEFVPLLIIFHYKFVNKSTLCLILFWE